MERIDMQEASDIIQANVNKIVDIKTATGNITVRILEALDEKEISPFWKVEVIEGNGDIESLTIDGEKTPVIFLDKIDNINKAA